MDPSQPQISIDQDSLFKMEKKQISDLVPTLIKPNYRLSSKKNFITSASQISFKWQKLTKSKSQIIPQIPESLKLTPKFLLPAGLQSNSNLHSKFQKLNAELSLPQFAPRPDFFKKLEKSGFPKKPSDACLEIKKILLLIAKLTEQDVKKNLRIKKAAKICLGGVSGVLPSLYKFRISQIPKILDQLDVLEFDSGGGNSILGGEFSEKLGESDKVEFLRVVGRVAGNTDLGDIQGIEGRILEVPGNQNIKNQQNSGDNVLIGQKMKTNLVFKEQNDCLLKGVSRLLKLLVIRYLSSLRYKVYFSNMQGKTAASTSILEFMSDFAADLLDFGDQDLFDSGLKDILAVVNGIKVSLSKVRDLIRCIDNQHFL